jgi:hypothetical protein
MTQEALNHYVTQFADRVTHVYQPKGFLLNGLYQRPIDVNGSQVVWPVTGRIEAVQHQRGSKAPDSNAANTNVTAVMADYQAADWIYKVDIAKIKYDEMSVAAERVGRAAGRKRDMLLINELNASGAAILDASGAAFTLIHALTAIKTLGDNDIDWDEGDVVCGLPPLWWQQFISYKQVNSSDWVGSDGLPYKTGQRFKRWNRVFWFEIPKSYCPIPSANNFDAFMWSKSAIGFGDQGDDTKVSYENLYSGWLHNRLFSAVAKTIQPAGIIRLRASSNAAITLN